MKEASKPGSMQDLWKVTLAWSDRGHLDINRRFCRLTIMIKEEACMKYVNAKILLPDMLVKELQEYIQGGYIYIPAIGEQRKCWGESSGYRDELQQRNRKIADEYQKGASIDDLADEYCLSIHTIRKIVYQK